MMSPFVILDLGATLVEGPTQGPATRIGVDLALSSLERSRLQAALMTRPWEHPCQVVAFLRDEMAVQHPRLEQVVYAVWAAQELEAEPVAGAEAVLNNLLEAGFKIGIISNIWRPFLTGVNRHFGPVLSSIGSNNQFYSFREGEAKPSAGLFRRALLTSELQPDQAIMIGDSYREDIEPAARLGLKTLWLLHRPAKEVSNIAAVLNGAAPSPSLTLRSIADLEPQLIRNIFWDSWAFAGEGEGASPRVATRGSK